MYEDKALEASSGANLRAGVCMFDCNFGTKCFLYQVGAEHTLHFRAIPLQLPFI